MTTATTRRRHYTVSLILDLRGSAEAPDVAIDRLKEILKSIDCKVSEVENLGQREFSRAVDRKFLSGLYVQIKFEGPSLRLLLSPKNFVSIARWTASWFNL